MRLGKAKSWPANGRANLLEPAPQAAQRRRGPAWPAAAGALAAAAILVVLLHDASTHGALQAWQAKAWPEIRGQMPGAIHNLSVVFAILGDVHVLLTLSLAAFLSLAWKREWRHAYLAIACGPALLGVLAWMRWHVSTIAPDGRPPPFPLTGSFPNENATLAFGLLGLAWILVRTRRARVLAVASAAIVSLAPLALGRAWPLDTLAGIALGGGWTCLAFLGSRVARQLTEPAPAWRPLFIDRLRSRWAGVAARADQSWWGNERVLLVLIGIGLLARLPGLWTWAIGPDADRYSAMAHALQTHGSFLMPWGDVYSPGTGPQPSHHYPPLYPMVLAGFFQVFGFSRGTTQLASLALSLLAVATTWWCTRSLYGRKPGLVAAAAVALNPILIQTTNKAYSENLLMVLFVLTMWAILRSLDKPWFIVLAGLFAGLSYLTKSSVGAFFLVAGFAGLAWRLRWRGLKVLRDPGYLAAIAIFAALVAAWAWRNWRLFGDWQTSTHISAAYDNALHHPFDWALLIPFSFTFLFALGMLGYLAMIAWLPQLSRSFSLKNEHDSGLWLGMMLPLVLTVPIDSALWLYEKDFFLHNVRYIVLSLVPMVWLLIRNVKPSRATWAALFVTAGMLLAGSLYYTLPNRPLDSQVSERLGPLVHDTDSITFVGTNDVYRYYFDLTDNGRRNLDVRYSPGDDGGNATSTWIVVLGDWSHIHRPPYEEEFQMQAGSGDAYQQYTVWRYAAPPI